MATPRVPAPLTEGRSGEKEVFQLVNTLRAHLLSLETSFQVLTLPPADAPNGGASMSFRYATTTGLLYVWDPAAVAWQVV